MVVDSRTRTEKKLNVCSTRCPILFCVPGHNFPFFFLVALAFYAFWSVCTTHTEQNRPASVDRKESLVDGCCWYNGKFVWRLSAKLLRTHNTRMPCTSEEEKKNRSTFQVQHNWRRAYIFRSIYRIWWSRIYSTAGVGTKARARRKSFVCCSCSWPALRRPIPCFALFYFSPPSLFKVNTFLNQLPFVCY